MGLKPGKRTNRRDRKLPEVPKELLWDYPEAPKDLLWRLQRIADFFPQWGRDFETIRLLHRNRAKLRTPPEIDWLIEICYQEWMK